MRLRYCPGLHTPPLWDGAPNTTEVATPWVITDTVHGVHRLVASFPTSAEAQAYAAEGGHRLSLPPGAELLQLRGVEIVDARPLPGVEVPR